MFQCIIITLVITTSAIPVLVLSEDYQDEIETTHFSNDMDMDRKGIKHDAERVKRVTVASLLARGFLYGVRLRSLWDLKRATRILLANAKIVDKGKNVETYVKAGGKTRAQSDFRSIRPRNVQNSGSMVSKSEGVVGDSAVELINWDVGRNAPGYTIIMSNKNTLKIVMYRGK